ncbi:Zn-ribbon domain-containing OB-fold protein [Pollutimonas harenae]|uniref:Zn-ribbon domain-containing OB-fold protein n=1 Tax=Pollutimonas harenae TaxID=657015 RepID=A0A853H2V2_9BURK|nr:Zn-ribbon domain-containing OB-fold protein [Pollutimonas harenae]NYT84484.1 Zn-ribbon domain-containing OB-fold protein [Pollutimonas harenae]TEA73119.1 Zn-ribbon domain-containing OB-fold protein [Pollutimonas harenae]
MDKHNNGPDTSGPQARYFSRLNEGVFEIQRCKACERHQFFPRVLCQHCGSTDLAWVTPSGKGQVYSFSVIRRKPDSGGDYNVALVDLDEGVRLMSRVDGVSPDAIHIGMAVSAKVLNEQDKGMLVFLPEGQK